MQYLGHALIFFFLCFCVFTRNSHLFGRPVFLFAKSGNPSLSGPHPVSQPGAHRRRERPARCSHAGRSLATRPQREPGRRNLSTCLINGGAETAAQTGLRQAHKEEAPRPLPPSIDPDPLWLGQTGARRLAGTRPILLRGRGPKAQEDRRPASPPHRSPSCGLQASGLGGCPDPFRGTGQGTGWGRTRPRKAVAQKGVEPASEVCHPHPVS